MRIRLQKCSLLLSSPALCRCEEKGVGCSLCSCHFKAALLRCCQRQCVIPCLGGPAMLLAAFLQALRAGSECRQRWPLRGPPFSLFLQQLAEAACCCGPAVNSPLAVPASRTASGEASASKKRDLFTLEQGWDTAMGVALVTATPACDAW